MRILRLLSVVLCFMLLPTMGLAQAQGGSKTMRQIEKDIAKIRTCNSVDGRTDAAERLAKDVQKLSNSENKDALVIDLIDLLDSSDDSVRYWIAISIGNMGAAAKAAIPKLEAMLPQADRINGAITSASGIRYALIKMGVKLPPPSKHEVIAG